ncbi:hypothetical protein FS749_016640 [Ceratobasidium sp. UAMH 11750]|nr:hypothetical protein FS749_016640 [Ceratobasidium sp. UAMH 11750]
MASTDTASPTAAGTQRGSLTIAGSGIASVSHMTLQTLSYLKSADKVYYIVCDAVTEAFIQDNSKGNYFDLSAFYDKDKHRYKSYVQMSEAMLKDVRAGQDVLGIFYGHPGVFVSPSHRALTLARREGYDAKMLPGISAEDYMFADLEFDPAQYGCMTREHRGYDYGLSGEYISSSTSCFGLKSPGIIQKSKFHLLVDLLERDFGPEHKAVHYIGAVLPTTTTIMDTFTIADLRREDVAKQFNTVSTLYVPPREVAAMHEPIAAAMGTPDAPITYLHPSSSWVGSRFVLEATYGAVEQDAVVQMDRHVAPEKHKILHASPAMKKFMTDLTLNPTALEEYKANPTAVTESVQGLTERERFALKLAQSSAVQAVMTRTKADIESGREPTDEELAIAAQSSVYQTSAAAVSVVIIALLWQKGLAWAKWYVAVFSAGAHAYTDLYHRHVYLGMRPRPAFILLLSI